MTDERFDDAILEARKIDSDIEMGLSEDVFKKKPFLGTYFISIVLFLSFCVSIFIFKHLGVPFTAKESYAVAGMLHTLGIVSRIKCRAEVDAEAIKLMKDAGAILIAISNVPEINKWFISFILQKS